MQFWELWESLTIPSKIIVSVCKKLSCLSACKKSTSSLASFLRYCKEIANLLFWVISACLATHTENDSINLKKSLMFTCKQKINFILPVFLEILQRYCKLVVLGTFNKPGYTHLKYYHLVENFRIYLQAKETLQSHDFLKDMQTSYFGYFGHVWIRTPKMVTPTCRKF